MNIAPLTAADVQWSAYDRWEGPRVGGRCPFHASSNPSWQEKLLAVISATEGNYDSVNMYDRAICSVGVVQWIELGQMQVSNMLGRVAEDAPDALRALADVMAASGVTFAKSGGRWRFLRGTSAIETPDALRWLYFSGASGLKGTWPREAKEHARAWASSLANVFADEGAQRAQIAFTAPQLESFAFAPAKRILWDGSEPENEGLHGAMRAAFLSYAVNLPAVASSALVRGAAAAKGAPWSLAWCVEVLREIVFGAQVAIWPARYNRIRKPLEELFSVDLPDYAEELRGLPIDGLNSARSIQLALAKLGFDPGPPDGIWGRASTAATIAFQRARGLDADGVVGPATRARLRADLDAATLPAA